MYLPFSTQKYNIYVCISASAEERHADYAAAGAARLIQEEQVCRAHILASVMVPSLAGVSGWRALAGVSRGRAQRQLIRRSERRTLLTVIVGFH